MGDLARPGETTGPGPLVLCRLLLGAALLLTSPGCGEDPSSSPPPAASKPPVPSAPPSASASASEPPSVPPLAESGPPAHPPPLRHQSSDFRFTDVSAESGIILENVSGDPVAKMAIVENIGQGAAALDYDRDGRLDFFVANGDMLPGQAPRADPRCALYHNEDGFRFRDVTEEAGLVFSGWVHGAWAVDFDADGFTDLYLTCYRRENVFFRNQGDGTFKDVTAAWGGADPGPSSCAAFFDADGDGDLDLYVGNYVDYDPLNPPNQGNPCSWKGLAVSCGPLGTVAGADTFYQNQDGRLVEASQAFGFAEVEASYALGCVTGDFDDDGDQDLYVANDSRPNYLFQNQGGSRFREVAINYGVDMNEDGRAQAGMGVDFGDLDNDGRFDIFVTNFSHDTNTFYHNTMTPDGRTFFTDATFVSKLGEDSFHKLSWGTRIIDLDRDGWQDVVVVCGHVYPQVDQANLGTSYAQENQIFWNQGPDEAGKLPTFKVSVPKPGDGFLKKKVSRGLVAADLDGDGDHDLLIVEMDARPTLLRNDTPARGHWIGFSLLGSGLNREAIGARLGVRDSRGVTRHRERTFGSGYFSTSDPRLLLGLGEAGGKVEEVHVRWPSGRVQVHPGLAVDRYWVLEEDSGKARPWP